MTWTPISCERREALVDALGRSYGGFSDESGIGVVSSLTDPDGQFGSPLILTEWAFRDSEVNVLKDVRHPDPRGGKDTAPCEHFAWIVVAPSPSRVPGDQP